MNLSKTFAALAVAVTLITFSGNSFAGGNLNASFFPDKYASLVVDTNSNVILQQSNADSIRYPASLTKLMTLYLTFEQMKYGKLNIDESVTVSRHAASQPRMNLALRAGERITIRNLIKSVVVLSANDSAVVLAEKVAGTENNFAKRMTERAHQLGMKRTNFSNASGLPNKYQVTTAKDIAKLMIALKRDFPQYYSMLSANSFVYKGRTYGTHNRLMKSYAGAKAGKTGFINASGFNLTLEATKNGHDIVGVVLGGRSAVARDNHMKNILDNNFAMLDRNNATRSSHFAMNNAANYYRTPERKPGFQQAFNK